MERRVNREAECCDWTAECDHLLLRYTPLSAESVTAWTWMSTPRSVSGGTA